MYVIVDDNYDDASVVLTRFDPSDYQKCAWSYLYDQDCADNPLVFESEQEAQAVRDQVVKMLVEIEELEDKDDIENLNQDIRVEKVKLIGTFVKYRLVD